MNMIADDSEHDRTWNEINYELVSTMARMSEYILNSVNHYSFKLNGVSPGHTTLSSLVSSKGSLFIQSKRWHSERMDFV